ncbi:MAG: chorismate lyase [Pseudomonadota bacterium]|nr:chorismate lyase [Pseudomonadota bacterium]
MKNLSSTNQWYLFPEDTGEIPEPKIYEWLTETGLLTARLKILCSKSFGLKVLDSPSKNIVSIKKRQILLFCGDTACIYAETLIPKETITKHAWLASLGDEPLGERLRTQKNVSRSEFQYSLISPPRILLEYIASKSLLWARRSIFKIGAYSISVTEIFLPGILDCDN